MSPEYWTTNAFNNPAIFDRTFSDNPAFAGVTNLDRKLASAADKWNTLQKEISDYSNIVMQTWVKAYEEFCDDTEEKIKSEIPPTSWKDLTDNWLNIANQALVEMQKSEGYLATQKKAIDANSEYRLAEQTIVEEYCKLYHLPTRSEIDDLHKKVYELNKELRELRKAKRQQNQSSTSKTSSTRKPAAKTNANR
jgi:class III poly(R)-hydroxyalkanoic acid synthase PhaE subunit